MQQILQLFHSAHKHQTNQYGKARNFEAKVVQGPLPPTQCKVNLNSYTRSHGYTMLLRTLRIQSRPHQPCLISRKVSPSRQPKALIPSTRMPMLRTRTLERQLYFASRRILPMARRFISQSHKVLEDASKREPTNLGELTKEEYEYKIAELQRQVQSLQAELMHIRTRAQAAGSHYYVFLSFV